MLTPKSTIDSLSSTTREPSQFPLGTVRCVPDTGSTRAVRLAPTVDLAACPLPEHSAMPLSERSLRATLLLLVFLFSLAPLTRAADPQFASREQRYHLHPGDVITVNYRYTPEYNATVSLQPDGFATLPLLGELKLGGLTLTEAHDALLAKANERLNEPELTLDLKEFEKPYFIVGGEVGAPGKFEFRGPTTALRAVQLAGGIKSSGKASQILLIRPINGVDAQTKLINLKNVIDHRDLAEDIEVRAGDVLIVPKTWIAKVEPLVKLSNFGLYLNPLNY